MPATTGKPRSPGKVAHGRRASDVPERVRGRGDAPAARARVAVAAREEERRRLAAELHDGVGTNLATVKMSLSSITQALPPGALHEKRLLLDAQQLLNDTIVNIRELCSGLQPTLLQHAGLSEALSAHCTRLSMRTGLAIELDLDLDALRFAPEIELMLLRIAQEALWNCVKHANASKVRVGLTHAGARRRFAIEDDGRGFDMTQAASLGDGRGVGIAGMRERALSVAATLTLRSAPGQGTTVVVDF